MIDKEILDAVIPVPELDELKEAKITELEEEGFTITNFHSGGVFHTNSAASAIFRNIGCVSGQSYALISEENPR